MAEKVMISLIAGPDTPALMQKQYKLGRESSISFIHEWLKKQLKRQKSDPMFVFVQPGDSIGFSPTPEQLVGDLCDTFSDGKRLSLYYAFKETWG